MNTQEQLLDWFNKVSSAEKFLKRIVTILGNDNAIHEELGAILEAYTISVATLVGDKNNAMEWFWQENDLGGKSLLAVIGEEKRLISTISDLEWLIEVQR